MPMLSIHIVTTILITTSLYCGTHAAACQLNEITLLGPNSTSRCWPCSHCDIGYGLNIECGRQYPEGTHIECVPCISGVSYSSVRDISQCKQCMQCGQYRRKSGYCDEEGDTTKCSDSCSDAGYYYDKSHHECLACIACCGDDKDVHEPQCVGNTAKNKQCRGPRAEICVVPTTDGDLSSRHTHSISTGTIVAIVIGSFIGVVLVVAMVALFLCTAEQRRRFLCCCCNALRKFGPRQASGRQLRHQVIFNNGGDVATSGHINPVPSDERSPEISTSDSRRGSNSYGRSISHPGTNPRSSDQNANKVKTARSLGQLKEHIISMFRSNSYSNFQNERSTSDYSSSASDGVVSAQDAMQHHHTPQTIGQITHDVMVHHTQLPSSTTVMEPPLVDTSHGNDVALVTASPSCSTEQSKVKEALKNIPRQKLDESIENLDYKVRQEICSRLNARKTPQGNDFRMLAQFAEFKDYQIVELDQRSNNPMKEILDVLQTTLCSIEQLTLELIRIDRYDVASTIIDGCNQSVSSV